MSDAADLERVYRRWLALYPAWFRREYEAEILEVLVAGAGDRACGPDMMECLGLVTNALYTRIWPRVHPSEHSTLAAIKLMYIGAVVELVTALTVFLTAGDVRSNIINADPGFSATSWNAVVAQQIEPNAIGGVLAVGFWLWAAWAIAHAHPWTRALFAIFFALNLFGLGSGLVHGSAVYARPDLAVATVLCLLELVALVVIFRIRIQTTPSGAARRV